MQKYNEKLVEDFIIVCGRFAGGFAVAGAVWGNASVARGREVSERPAWEHREPAWSDGHSESLFQRFSLGIHLRVAHRRAELP